MEGRKLVRSMERVFAVTRLSDEMLARAYQNLLQVAEQPDELTNRRQGHQGERSRKRRRLTTTGGRS